MPYIELPTVENVVAEIEFCRGRIAELQILLQELQIAERANRLGLYPRGNGRSGAEHGTKGGGSDA